MRAEVSRGRKQPVIGQGSGVGGHAPFANHPFCFLVFGYFSWQISAAGNGICPLPILSGWGSFIYEIHGKLYVDLLQADVICSCDSRSAFGCSSSQHIDVSPSICHRRPGIVDLLIDHSPWRLVPAHSVVSMWCIFVVMPNNPLEGECPLFSCVIYNE